MNNHQNAIFHQITNFLKTPLALLGVDLKNFQFNKICHFANHPYLCKGLFVLFKRCNYSVLFGMLFSAFRMFTLSVFFVLIPARGAILRKPALLQNGYKSTPFCALMFALKACLISFTSLTVSAISIKLSEAALPVITTCWLLGRLFRVFKILVSSRYW